MKKLFILVVCLLSFQNIVAQEEEPKERKSIEERKHEFRIGGIKLLGELVEVSYEYINNSNSGFGVSVLFNLQKNSDYLEQFSITSFYRMYFTSNEDFGAKGFYAEGHAKLATGEDAIFTTNEGKYTDFSLGIGVGQKWINSNGFVVDLSFGVSRTLGGNTGHDVYLRGGLGLGYRF